MLDPTPQRGPSRRPCAALLTALLVGAGCHVDPAPTVRAPAPTPTSTQTPAARAPASCVEQLALRFEGSRPVLGDRLRLGVDPGTRLEQPPQNPAVVHSMERLSEFAMVRGGLALVLHAHEDFERAPDDETGLAELESERLGPARVEPFRSDSGVEGFLVATRSTDPRTASSVGTLIVRMPEGTGVRIEVDVVARSTPFAPADCTPVLAEVARHVTLGPARLSTEGGTFSIGPYLELAVPSGYFVESTTLPESASLTVERPHRRGEPPFRLTIEATQHPPNIGTPRERSGPYLGRTVSWRDLYAEGLERRSAVLHIPRHEAYYAYSLIEVPTDEDVATFVALAGRIRVVR